MATDTNVEPELTTDPETVEESSVAVELPGGEQPLAARVESLLVSTDRPLSEARLGALLALPGKGTAQQVREAIDELNKAYECDKRSFRIERLAGGWQMLTLAGFGDLIARLHSDRQQQRLSQAALETLAIVAYRQPVMRAEIEAIRGVACGEVLRGLLDRRLVKIVGRAEELGRPMLYGSTRLFLEVFGISSLDDLPPVEDVPQHADRGAVSLEATTETTPDAGEESSMQDDPEPTEHE